MSEKDNRVMFRAKPLLLKMLEDRAEPGRSQEAVARFLLEACLYTLPDSLPTFSEDEALYICNFLNGISIHSDTFQFLHRDLIKDLAKSNQDDFDTHQLKDRLEAITPFEWLAIVDASQRYYRGEYYKDADEVSKRLREVGLVRE